MASIPGSQFTATAPHQAVTVAETSNGNVPSPVPGTFNLEVWTDPPGSAPTSPAPGYQGLAVLSNAGQQIDLISGAFAVTDHGSGHDTINARGTDETISGGAANVTLNLYGNNDVANAGGQDTITVFGNNDTVNGSGNDSITVLGDHDLVKGGHGNDTINVFADFDTVNAGSGRD